MNIAGKGSLLDRIESTIEEVVAWVESRPDIVAVGLVGSYARGTARPDSDVDFVILAEDPNLHLDHREWVRQFGDPHTITQEDWGKVQSLRVFYADGLEIEFGLASPGWASVDPIDWGTREVVSGGLRILADSRNLLTTLQCAVIQSAATAREAVQRNETTLHLIIGLPGSGKTTLAKQLERQHSALRLTPDEWVTRLFGVEVTKEADIAHDTVEALLWQIATRVLSLGVDVVLDFGCWARVERETFRSEAARVGARSVLYFLDVPLEELLRRVESRNAHVPPDTFRIDPALVKLWAETIFQAPSADELLPRDSRGLPEPQSDTDRSLTRSEDQFVR